MKSGGTCLDETWCSVDRVLAGLLPLPLSPPACDSVAKSDVVAYNLVNEVGASSCMFRFRTP